MSDSEVENDGSSGIKVPRFHIRRGEDYGLWRLRLRAACRVKGAWNVVQSDSDLAVSTTTTATGSRTESQIAADALRIATKREKASGKVFVSCNLPARDWAWTSEVETLCQLVTSSWDVS